jgi:hypothetical protein
VTAEEVVAACAATIEPLATAANAAWWTANVDARAETERLRSDADLALSDALADPAAFAEVRAARSDRSLDPLLARQLEVLEQSFVPNQVEAGLRREIVELQSNIESRFAR